MSNRFTVDFFTKKIIGTKNSFDKAKHYGTEEYNELCGLMSDNPGFEIVVKEIRQNKSKQSYKKLNFQFIESYISIQPDAKKSYRNTKQSKSPRKVWAEVFTLIPNAGFLRSSVARINLLTWTKPQKKLRMRRLRLARRHKEVHRIWKIIKSPL